MCCDRAFELKCGNRFASTANLFAEDRKLTKEHKLRCGLRPFLSICSGNSGENGTSWVVRRLIAHSNGIRGLCALSVLKESLSVSKQTKAKVQNNLICWRSSSDSKKRRKLLFAPLFLIIRSQRDVTLTRELYWTCSPRSNLKRLSLTFMPSFVIIMIV
jgi:hypothetical protein